MCVCVCIHIEIYIYIYIYIYILHGCICEPGFHALGICQTVGKVFRKRPINMVGGMHLYIYTHISAICCWDGYRQRKRVYIYIYIYTYKLKSN